MTLKKVKLWLGEGAPPYKIDTQHRELKLREDFLHSWHLTASQWHNQAQTPCTFSTRYCCHSVLHGNTWYLMAQEPSEHGSHTLSRQGIPCPGSGLSHGSQSRLVISLVESHQKQQSNMDSSNSNMDPENSTIVPRVQGIHIPTLDITASRYPTSPTQIKAQGGGRYTYVP